MRNQPDIDREAYEWVAAVQSDGASDGELEQFEQWLTSDPRHQAAFERVESLFGDIAELKDMEALIGAAPARQAGWGIAIRTAAAAMFARPLIPAGLAAAMAAALVFIFLNIFEAPGQSQRIATRIAEIREISLPDGSSLTLGAKSVVEIDFENARRHVALLDGQAFFDVARDPDRPFTIKAGEADIEVLGTAFDVTLLRDGTRVVVVEGVVSVKPSEMTGIDAQLIAGQAVSVLGAGALGDIQAADLEMVEAWRKGRLLYNEAPLGDVISELNRYAVRPLELAPDIEKGLTLTGSFRASDVESVIRTLSATHDLEIVATIDGGRILQRQEEE